MKPFVGAVVGIAIGLAIGALAGSHQRDIGFRSGVDRATAVLQRDAVRNGHARWRRNEDDTVGFEWIEVRPNYRGDDEALADR
jgi:hypothetical protein